MSEGEHNDNAENEWSDAITEPLEVRAIFWQARLATR